LFDGGKSKSAAAAAAVDMEWRPATATWYGDAEGDGSTGKLSELVSPFSAPHSSVESTKAYWFL
jgi:hypothetical protein